MLQIVAVDALVSPGEQNRGWEMSDAAVEAAASAATPATMRKKRDLRQCPHCGAAISTRSDVASEGPGCGLDHLYVLASEALPGICKVGRSHDPQARASELCQAMPFHLRLWCVFWRRGKEEATAHEALKSYSVKEGPGMEWFRLEPHDAAGIVARAIGLGWVPRGDQPMK